MNSALLNIERLFMIRSATKLQVSIMELSDKIKLYDEMQWLLIFTKKQNKWQNHKPQAMRTIVVVDCHLTIGTDTDIINLWFTRYYILPLYFFNCTIVFSIVETIIWTLIYCIVVLGVSKNYKNLIFGILALRL